MELQYKFRRVTEEDYEFVYQVKKTAYKAYVERNFGSWDDVLQREFFNKFMEACKEGAYIITTEGMDIGFFNGTESETEYEIGNICIIPEYQNKGIGTAVLKVILSKHADKEIRLQYFKQNPVGRLYERLGFVHDGETANHYQMKINCEI